MAHINSAPKGLAVGDLKDPEKDGWLIKQGGSVKNWKKRWCVLKGGVIYYFKNKTGDTPQGTMDLSASSAVRDVIIKKKQYTFTVVTEKREFNISAETEDAKRAWMDAINKSIKDMGASGKPSTGGTPPQPAVATTNGTGAHKPEPAKAGNTAAAGARAPRAQLAKAKQVVPFLSGPEQKVYEFWHIWADSIPQPDETGSPVEFYVSTSASMQKLNWRTSGPQHLFIQKMVDFFWGVGAPESEIDKLNDVGGNINPTRIGSWIDMSARGGMDGGWYFPVHVPAQLAFKAADDGEAVSKLSEWCRKHNIDSALSVGRDMGAAPPRQTEIVFKVPGASAQDQVRTALDAFDTFKFPKIPENALKILQNTSTGQLRLSVITASEGFVRMGIMVPKPTQETVVNLCNCVQGNKDSIATFEGALGVAGPSYVEYQYLREGFGYSVYKEGFDIIFHYDVGSESL